MQTVIIGAGGHGRVVLDIFRQAHQADPVGFIDANPDLLGTRVDGVEVIAPAAAIGSLAARGVDSAIVAIGDNSTRNMYAQTLRAHGLRLVNAIHPKSNVADTALLGQNVVIAAGAVVLQDVEPFTTVVGVPARAIRESAPVAAAPAAVAV
jgi:UDP-perosamine 4-acetyltransferase